MSAKPSVTFHGGKKTKSREAARKTDRTQDSGTIPEPRTGKCVHKADTQVPSQAEGQGTGVTLTAIALLRGGGSAGHHYQSVV